MEVEGVSKLVHPSSFRDLKERHKKIEIKKMITDVVFSQPKRMIFVSIHTMANFFAPLQLICRSFVFIVFLLEFFCNIFVLLKQNIYRQILLFSFKNFVSKYKIIAKVNFLINPFAKKLQVL